MLKDIDIARESYSCTQDYSHVLNEINRGEKYSLYAQHGDPEENGVPIRVHVLQNDVEVGRLSGWVAAGLYKPVLIDIDPEHQHKGLGMKLYGAAFIHAKEHLEAVGVMGAEHSQSAHKVLLGLAEKTGIYYKIPLGVTNPSDDNAVFKSEFFAKAISDIKPGDTQSHADKEVHNYSHILHSKLQEQGYSLHVHQPTGANTQNHSFSAILTHLSGSEPVGWVSGYPMGYGKMEPHAKIDHRHQGRGLGVAAYEALYAHAKGQGVTKVTGGDHTEAAARVHRKLAVKHGLDYKPKKNDSDPTGHGEYQYALKSEPVVDLDADEIETILRHPDPIERRMALKMSGFKPWHVLQIFQHPEYPKELKQLAIQTGLVNNHSLYDIISVADPADLWFLLNHAAMTQDHMRVMWSHLLEENHNLGLVLRFAQDYRLPIDLQTKITEHFPQAVEYLLRNPAVGATVVNEVIENAAKFGRSNILTALKSPLASPGLINRFARDYKADLELALAAITNPNIDPVLVSDLGALKRAHGGVSLPELGQLLTAVQGNPNQDIKRLALSNQQFEKSLKSFLE